MLSKQLQKQIEQEAIDGQQILPATEYSLGINKGYEIGYEAAGDKYGQLYETAVARAERAEKALRDFAKQIKMHCNKMGIRSVVIQCIANRMEELDITEALTPKTGEDE